MDIDSYLRAVPKVELHCHFEGTVRASTFADLAAEHGVALPTADVAKLYDYDTIYEFLKIFAMVSSTIVERDDFARCAYESLEDGVKLGNLRYREMFFNPTLHTRRGVPMARSSTDSSTGSGPPRPITACGAGSSPTSTARTRPPRPARWSKTSSPTAATS